MSKSFLTDNYLTGIRMSGLPLACVQEVANSFRFMRFQDEPQRETADAFPDRRHLSFAPVS